MVFNAIFQQYFSYGGHFCVGGNHWPTVSKTKNFFSLCHIEYTSPPQVKILNRTNTTPISVLYYTWKHQMHL